MWPRENYFRYEDGKRTWELENIIKWMKHSTLISWKAWHPSGKGDEVSRGWDRHRPPLFKLTLQFPDVFANMNPAIDCTCKGVSALRYSPLVRADLASLRDFTTGHESTGSPSLGPLPEGLGDVEIERLRRHAFGQRARLQNIIASSTWKNLFPAQPK